MNSCGEIILGIDPGSLVTGFGLITKNNQGDISHLSHGTIILNKKEILSQRLASLALDLRVIIEKYRPTMAVVEDVFFSKNARSALVLGQARGCALGVFGLYSIPVFSLSPTKAKSVITGNGQAQKFQVAHMLALRLGIEVPTSQDASDGLALAMAAGLSSFL